MSIGKSVLLAAGLLLCATATTGLAQQGPAAREDALDPSPVNSPADPDIDLFINDWRNATPRTLFGALQFHDILIGLDTADPVRPNRKGAVLTGIAAVSYVTLAPGATASGQARPGQHLIFYTTTGKGQLAAAAATHEVREGIGFTLTPEFDFQLKNSGDSPLGFYVRTEALPASAATGGRSGGQGLVVVDRFDNDRRVGAHWAHICNGGPQGLNLCTVAPYSIPQPHSHPAEEVWVLVKGESILSLGKELIRMQPGQAFKIPPTGLTAHSNINLNKEPIELLFLGPAVRTPGPAPLDYARLDNSPYDPANEPDIDMYLGNWRDAYPRIEHGNLYFRDMLTSLAGADSRHPVRRGAVLSNARAVSYAMLEPGSTAHPVAGEPGDRQQIFVVQSGEGVIASGSERVNLAKGMAFLLAPGLDFRLTATGDDYMTFYVVTEDLPAGFQADGRLRVVDNRQAPPTVADWHNKVHALLAASDGLTGYQSIERIELDPLSMSRPQSSGKDDEEIWIATDDSWILLGKLLRHVEAGTAYRVPPTGISAQSNINVTDRPAGFLRLSR